MIYDLHTHTDYSDGKLNVSDLLNRAERFCIDTISITDHDTIEAYQNTEFSHNRKIRVIPGVELSTYWKKTGIHVVGLNIDLNSIKLNDVLRQQSEIRKKRAVKIIERINSKYDCDINFNGISKYAFNNHIGRPHIAEYLVDKKMAKNYKHAFEKYLSEKKLGSLKYDWLAMSEIIQAINDSGGIPVLAHPLKYKITRTKLIELIQDFKSIGGQAIEVISGKQPSTSTNELANICNSYSLYASCGSDFHHPNTPWAELGQFGKLPKECEPVWKHFHSIS